MGQTNIGFGVRVENFGGVRCVLIPKTVGLFVFPALLGATAFGITFWRCQLLINLVHWCMMDGMQL